MKTYILRKDTPKSKAGEKLKFRQSIEQGLFYRSESGEDFSKKIVENNPEWFELIEFQQEKQIKAIDNYIMVLTDLKNRVRKNEIELIDSNLEMSEGCNAINPEEFGDYQHYEPTGDISCLISLTLYKKGQ